MQIAIDYRTTYLYQRPVRSLTQAFRVTPLEGGGQTVLDWSVEVSPALPLRVSRDSFGNTVHLLFAAGPVDRLEVAVRGLVQTCDTGGIVRLTPEPMAAEAYLRDTPLTRADPAIAAFTREIAGAGDGLLAQLHRSLGAIHARIAFDTDATDPRTDAAEAFSLGRGVCQDFAHIFIAVARGLGSPARYVSGHFARADGVIDQTASHAWAEVLVPDLGWVGFDPTNGICTTDQHVRVAVALDYLGAAPFRGARVGGGDEQMTVHIRVEPMQTVQAQ